MTEDFILTGYIKPPCVGLYKTRYGLNWRHNPFAHRFWNGSVWCSLVDCEPMSWLTSREMFWSN